MAKLYENKAVIVKKRGGGTRVIPAGKWFINRNTPVGEDAEFYERMPYEGRRYHPWENVLGNVED